MTRPALPPRWQLMAALYAAQGLPLGKRYIPSVGWLALLGWRTYTGQDTLPPTLLPELNALGGELMRWDLEGRP